MAIRAAIGSVGLVPIGSITLKDLESYLSTPAVEQQGAVAAPYTLYQGTKQTGQLTEPQLNSALAQVGFSSGQIATIDKGSGTGSWLSIAIQGITGGLAALGPEAAAGGDLLDLFGIGSKVEEIEPADQAEKPADQTKPPDDDDGSTPKTSTPSAQKLLQTGSNAALMTIWADIAGDAKYAAIWVGLMILGIALILIGVSHSTPRRPTLSAVIPT